MNHLTFIPAIFLALFSIFFWNCSDANAQKGAVPEASADLTFAVIKYDPSKKHYIFKNLLPAELSGDEISKIADLTVKAAEDYDSKQKQPYKLKKLSEYKFQYVPALDEKGEKHVWVNAFCDDFGTNWKTEIVFVSDGGSCFFNFKINLKTSAVYDFSVNGEA